MQQKQDTYNVGVLVCRFQVAELTEAHKELVELALSNHAKVLIFLGLSPIRGSINDPLDFQPRKQMILEAYPPSRWPNLYVGYIKDCPNDSDWSNKLDELICDHLGPNDKAILYGGRDSFLGRYNGSFPTKELVSNTTVSATEMRNLIAQAPQSSIDFRRGAIWAAYQRFPTVYPTVDVCIYDSNNKRILLGRKPNEKLYRFVGGFASPTDESFEKAALRELSEETGLTVGLNGLQYVGSVKVNDWRYVNSPQEKIITHLYMGFFSFGCPKAGDDLAEVKWFDLNKIDPEFHIVDTHKPLFKMVTEWLSKNMTAKAENK